MEVYTRRRNDLSDLLSGQRSRITLGDSGTSRSRVEGTRLNDSLKVPPFLVPPTSPVLTEGPPSPRLETPSSYRKVPDRVVPENGEGQRPRSSPRAWVRSFRRGPQP